VQAPRSNNDHWDEVYCASHRRDADVVPCASCFASASNASVTYAYAHAAICICMQPIAEGRFVCTECLEHTVTEDEDLQTLFALAKSWLGRHGLQLPAGCSCLQELPAALRCWRTTCAAMSSDHFSEGKAQVSELDTLAVRFAGPMPAAALPEHSDRHHSQRCCWADVC
jgi:hypothetical protein